MQAPNMPVPLTKKTKISPTSLNMLSMLQKGCEVFHLLGNLNQLSFLIEAVRDFKSQSGDVLPVHQLIDYIIGDSVKEYDDSTFVIADKNNFISKLIQLKRSGMDALSVLERYYHVRPCKRIITADILYCVGFKDPSSFMHLFKLFELCKANYKIEHLKPRPKMRDLAVAGYPYSDIKKVCKRTTEVNYIRAVWYAAWGDEKKRLMEFFKEQGFNAKTIYDADNYMFSLERLRSFGYTAKELRCQGIVDVKILELGWPLEDLKLADFSKDELDLVEIDIKSMNGDSLCYLAPKHIKIIHIKRFLSPCDLYVAGNENPLQDGLRLKDAAETNKHCFFCLPHTSSSIHDEGEETSKKYERQEGVLFTKEEVLKHYPEINESPRTLNSAPFSTIQTPCSRYGSG